MNKKPAKTLEEAIQNAIESLIVRDVTSPRLQAEAIKIHVKDFLSRKVSAEVLEEIFKEHL